MDDFHKRWTWRWVIAPIIYPIINEISDTRRKILGALADLDSTITGIGATITDLGADVTDAGTAIVAAIQRINTPGISEAEVAAETVKLNAVGSALQALGPALKEEVANLNSALNPPA